MFNQNTQRKYLPEFVYGSIDGIVTTFAVVSGVIGASLPSAIVLILGFANLFADGFSMAISNYLSEKSENKLNSKHRHKHLDVKDPRRTAFATFISFVLIGFIPLTSFVLALFIDPLKPIQFQLSVFLTAIAFIIVGYIRADVTNESRFLSIIETLLIGSIAAVIAYFVGFFLRSLA